MDNLMEKIDGLNYCPIPKKQKFFLPPEVPQPKNFSF